MKSTVLAAALACAEFAVAQQVLPSIDELNIDPPEPPSTVCGYIVNENLYNDTVYFYASDAIDCLISVPFNAAVATRFITWWTQLLQFQSNLAFIRDPPAGYQQPAYDIFAGLQRIQDRIDSGYYRNQYVFDADVQNISLATHDTHWRLYAGAINQFSFSAQIDIIAVSTDGQALPQIYYYDDLVYATTYGGYNSSPISTINGMPVVEYLESYAAQQSFGMVEPNADWNQLMASAAQNIVGGSNVFSTGGVFYPGDDLNITFQNGTTLPTNWLALYDSPGYTGPLETGGDFYNFYVLGIPPANYNETNAAYVAYTNMTLDDTGDDSDNSTASNSSTSTNGTISTGTTSWNALVPAYPADTITHQEDLGVTSSGVITGYFLKDIGTAVLSIPSFNSDGADIQTFGQAVTDFISNATDPSRNASKVVIDLQQNDGGLDALAFDTFSQFFPSRSPFAGSRMRSHPLGDVLGTTLTNAFQASNTSDDDYALLVSEEWVITDRINALTGQNFSSWQEFYGPLHVNGGNFSLTEQYNLTSSPFDEDVLGVDFDDCLYYQNCTGQSDVWAPSNVVILTDGTCASTCTLFVEMLTQIGVRSVVIGGQPRNGPMQAASGSRGAAAYYGAALDADFALAQTYDENNTAINSYNTDSGQAINYAGFTLLDQIRPNATIPNQFLYLPATCRIWWTLANFNNYTQLWHDAATAIWFDNSLCVAGSTNVTSPPKAVKRDETSAAIINFIQHDGASVSFAPTDSNITSGGVFDSALDLNLWTFCDGKHHGCGPGETPKSFGFSCKSNSCASNRGNCPTDTQSRCVCTTKCQNNGGISGSGPSCGSLTLNSNNNVAPRSGGGLLKDLTSKLYSGFRSPPLQQTQSLPCSTVENDDSKVQRALGPK